MDKKYLESLLSYDPNTGLFTWKINKGRVSAGSVCNNTQDQGYKKVNIDGKSYYLHRLVFLLEDGVFPNVVDHINGDVSDNKRINLRKTSRAGNRRNSKVSSNNISGVKNVHYNKKTSSYSVTMHVNGVRKSFGSFSTLEKAKQVADKAREDNHKEFAYNVHSHN